MLPSHKGSIQLFRIAGINVYLHWTWFLVAAYEISTRASSYTSQVWCAYEYLALFLIVLMHEFGHALACRSVGGAANQIILWPLGGVAFVDPPPRPGATLWSIAAGPLVNVALTPILFGALYLARAQSLGATQPNIYHCLAMVTGINVVLLVFNILPIYPLDGGQILRSLLWYGFGRARSLMIATTIGLVVVPVLVLVFVKYVMEDPWLVLIAVFAFTRSWAGFKQARALSQLEAAPRQAGCACPSCGASPPAGNFWVCVKCRQPMDMFASKGVCPGCGVSYTGIRCIDCGKTHPVNDFFKVSEAPTLPT